MSQGVLRLGWGREGTLSSALGWVACVVALFSPLQFSLWPCSEAPQGGLQTTPLTAPSKEPREWVNWWVFAKCVWPLEKMQLHGCEVSGTRWSFAVPAFLSETLIYWAVNQSLSSLLGMFSACIGTVHRNVKGWFLHIMCITASKSMNEVSSFQYNTDEHWKVLKGDTTFTLKTWAVFILLQCGDATCPPYTLGQQCPGLSHGTGALLSPCGIYLEPTNHLQVRTSMARHLAAQGSSCTCSPCWSCANVQQRSTAWGMVVYPVSALTRAMNSASRGAVWIAASVSTIFTIADLKTSLAQAQRSLRAWGAIAKPFLLGGCLRFAAADSEICFCILYSLPLGGL